MKQLKNKWRPISLGFLAVSYVVLVVVMQQPISSFILCSLIYLGILILVFLGTFVGTFGIILQVFIKKESLAVPLYNLAYKLKTNNPTILASYGLILLRNDEPSKALDCFNRGIESSKHYLSTKTLMSNVAICYWKMGEIDTAIEQYYAILKRFGDDDQTFLDEPEYTEEAMETVLSDFSIMYPQDYNTLGYLYITKKDYEKAEFFSKLALKKKEDYPSAYDNLGQIAYERGNLDEAEEHYEKALELKADLPDSLYYMGLIKKAKGDNENALAFFKKTKACNLDGLNTITEAMVNEQIASLS